MKAVQPDGKRRSESQEMSRRTAIRGVVIGGAAAALYSGGGGVVQAEEPTPGAGQCVATAPSLDESGIASVPLLVGGIVRDMPKGPVEVRISRLAMAPGTVIDAAVVPYPALMYIETGTTACPGAPDASSTPPTAGWSKSREPQACSTRRPARRNTSPRTSRMAPVTRGPS
jgi:hypothetical protein